MKIKETEISILIPTYNSAKFISKCLRSALNTDAGEIIISDDKSEDSTFKIVQSFNDKRIKCFQNPQRLGLWKNHLKLLKLSSKPWIKFLQADDYLEKNALGVFCNNNERNLSIISALSINEIVETKTRKPIFNFSSKRRWTSIEYLERLKIVGNELGTPTNTLIKKDNIILDEEFWRNDVSADLIMNVIAASKGDVVLLPPGPIIRRIHIEQDTNKQSLELFYKRLHNTIKILLNTNNQKITDFANVFCFIESIGLLRMILGKIARGELKTMSIFFEVFKNLKLVSIKILYNNSKYVVRMYRWKYGNRNSFDLNFDLK